MAVSHTQTLHEAPPHLVDAYNACRQQVLVESFLREVSEYGESINRARLEELAQPLIGRYSEDVLNDLLIIADRLPAATAAGWVTSHFSRAIGQFGMALRASAPEALRHAISQVLQVAVMDAEHRMNVEVRGWVAASGSSAHTRTAPR